MKTITVAQSESMIIELLHQAYNENIIIRSPEGSEFLLAEIDSFDREIELTRQNTELMKLLEQRARQTETVPLEEVKRQLGI